MTDICKTILENLYTHGYRYLAQDASRDTYAYKERPLKINDDDSETHMWVSQGGKSTIIQPNSPLNRIESLEFFMHDEPLYIPHVLAAGGV